MRNGTYLLGYAFGSATILVSVMFGAPWGIAVAVAGFAIHALLGFE
jgi:hypothetical protein